MNDMDRFIHSCYRGTNEMRAYLWLQITMNDIVATEQLERIENLGTEPLDESETEALERIALNELVQVDRQQF